MNAMNQNFSHVVRHRRSMREFLPQPLPAQLIQTVLEDAQQALQTATPSRGRSISSPGKSVKHCPPR